MAIEKDEAERIELVKELRKNGIEPYAGRFEKTASALEIRKKYDSIAPDTSLESDVVSFAGKIKSMRAHGKLIFMDLKDHTGHVQIYVSEDKLGKEFEATKYLGSGDYAGVRGYISKTRRGELSIVATELKLLTKSLLPLPSEWFGLKDVETRYRQRYLDMIMNPEVLDTFAKRSIIVQSIREFLVTRGFLEVHTPVLQPIYGGANARPFVTYHNDLKAKLYLRIAPELYLKRLIVGGYEKVFELGENFRNEGIDSKHNPEYTSMESYWAYADYKDNMLLSEEMISSIALKVCGSTKIKYMDKDVDLTPPWERITMSDSLKKYADVDVKDKTAEQLKEMAKEKGIKFVATASRGEMIASLFEELVESKLINPTFIYDYPTEVSPLAKRKTEDPNFTERFELFITGKEFGNSYSELSDPIDQESRFKDQVCKRDLGDQEAHPMDSDFITALKYGLPPTSGLGIGIDRLVMLLTNSASIKDVILFPQMKPEKEDKPVFGDEIKDTIIEKVDKKKEK